MLSVADALATVLAQSPRLQPKTVSLDIANGHILAEDVMAQEALPPFPASVKDGYAVVATDGPGTYPIVGEVTAGVVPEFTVTSGSVAYITTGAPIPTGADAVIMVEDTEPLDEQVKINASVKPGDDIRPIGSDIEAGQLILAAGERLDAAEIGLLATAGATRVPVYPSPTVAILSTGDELVEPTEGLTPGKIRDSNRSMLMAAVQAAGGAMLDLGIAKDSQAELEERIHTGLSKADVLLTSGGVSMGDMDFIKPLLEHAGQVHFGRIRMKPGKPLTFATATVDGQQKLIFGLPGNPVSSLVTFYLMAVPALRKLAGWPDPNLQRVQAHLAQPLPLDSYRPEYHRATVTWDATLNDGNGGFLATSTGSQASSRLLSMRTANALLALPQQEGILPAGSVVTALMIG